MKKNSLVLLILLLPVLGGCQQLDSVSKKMTSFKKQVYELVGLNTKVSKKKKKKRETVESNQAIENQVASDQKADAQPPSEPVLGQGMGGDSNVPQSPSSPDQVNQPLQQDTSKDADPKTTTPAESIPAQLVNEGVNPAEGVPTESAKTADNSQTPVVQADSSQKLQGAIPQNGQTDPADAAKPIEKIFNPDEGMPLKRLVQIGGEANWFKSDARYIYVGFDQNVSIWDLNLNPRGIITLEGKPVDLVSVTKNTDTLLYIREENNILEIVKLPALGAPSFVKGFQVDGPFEGAYTRTGGSIPSQDHLFVFLADRIQVLNVTDPEKIQVVAEPNIAEAQAITLTGSFAYVLKKGAMVVLDASNYTIPATVPLEGDYQLLGIKRSIDKNRIVLGKKDSATGKYVAYRLVSVNTSGGGISDMGTDTPLSRGYDSLSLNESAQYIEGISEGVPYLFDLSLNTEVAIKGVDSKSMMDFSVLDSKLLFLEKNQVKKFDWQMSDAKELVLSHEKAAGWPGSIAKFGIPSEFQLFLVTADKSGANYYETDNLKSRLLKPYSLPHIGDFKKVKIGLYGLYFLDSSASKIYLRKWDGAFSELTPISVLKPEDMDISATSDGDTLAILNKSKLKGESTATFFSIDKAGVAKKKTAYNVPLSSSLRIVTDGEVLVSACGTSGLCLIKIQAPDPELKGLARGPSVLTTKIKTAMDAGEAVAQSVLLSPGGKLALTYYTSSSGVFVSLTDLSLDNPVEAGVIPLPNTSVSQFEGLSFSHGGKRVLIPSDEGLLVYDIKDIKNPIHVFKWAVGKIDQVDVTNRGQTFCVGLSGKGILCADYQEAAAPTTTQPADESPQ